MIRIYAEWWNPGLLPRGKLWHIKAREKGCLRHEELSSLKVFDKVIVEASGVYQYDTKHLPIHGLVYRVVERWSSEKTKQNRFPHLLLKNPDSPVPQMLIATISHIDSYSVLNPMIQKVGEPYVHYLTLRPVTQQIRLLGLRDLAERELSTPIKVGKKISRRR